MPADQPSHFLDNVIFAYSRAQALADGVLVDVSQSATEAGFKIPVAITQAAWQQCVEWTDADNERQTYQDTSGRLWDVLCMLLFAIKRNKPTDCLFYQLHVVPRDGKAKQAKLTKLKAVIGSGDNGEPVITILLPTED
jgi:hypothetical protein